MSTNVREQLRQLTEAFDEFVDDVTIDDVLGHEALTGSDLDSAWIESEVDDPAQRPAWRRFGLAAAVLLLVAGLAGALAIADRGGPESSPSADSPTTTEVPTSAESLVQFVWPAPAGGYASLNELVGAFTTDVMRWTAFDLVGDVNDQQQPQAFTLTNTALNAEIAAIAVPSPAGWGFVQIGEGISASVGDNGDAALEFPSTEAVVSSLVTVRLADGTSIDTTVDTARAELPDVRLEQLLSVLVVGYDADGNAITAVGGQFNTDAAPPSPTTADDATAANSVPADPLQDEPYGPLDYATTDSALPLWPYANASDPAATTTGYGMQLCDSGYGTKILRVDPATGPAHAYSGTLCVFINLTEARPDAVTTCATTTDRFNYARCQRRTDQTDTAGAGTSVRALASEEQQTAMAAFPTATSWDQPEEFDVAITAAANATNTVDFEDNEIAVTITSAESDDSVDAPGVCFRADLAGATVDGCVGRGLLATGLAYGAFQDGDGPIEIIGIVPDEITEVDINGTTLTPTNNVWHYTTTQSAPLQITVRSTDGRVATTD
jgi:hypothetical protein